MKIFGIGFNKTGTTSLHHALLDLGFTSLHWGGPPTRRAVERAIAQGRPPLSDIDDVDGYSDIEPIYRNFEIMDRHYPGSRFVLTVRDLDDWLDSRRRHVERNRERHAVGDYHGVFLDVDVDEWRRDITVHHARVEAYFRGRSDLLRLSITEGEGYEKLCPFLGVEIPGSPFPWGNQDRSAD